MPVTTDQLVAEYLLREGSGATAHDTSGNGLDGTLSSGAVWDALGVILTTGLDYVLLPDAVLADDDTSVVDASLEVWAKTPNTSDSGYFIDFAWGNFELYVDSFGYVGDVYTTAGGGSHVASASPLTTDWTQVVFVRNGDDIRIYINGLIESTHHFVDTFPIKLSSSHGTKCIGGSSNPSGTSRDQTYPGVTIGEVRAYSKALSDAEVAANYSATSASYAGGSPTAPVIVSFTASPTPIGAGQFSTLSWTVSGASSVSISGLGAFAGAGSAAVNPSATTTYTLTATNTYGATTATVTVTVGGPGAPPGIISFTASPSTLFTSAPTTVTLAWTTADATSVSISGIGTVAASGSTTVSVSSNTSFTLTATNSYGTVSSTLTVGAHNIIWPVGSMVDLQKFKTVGSTIYCYGYRPVHRASGPDSSCFPAVYSSTDSGVTWSLPDPSHQPWAVTQTPDYVNPDPYLSTQVGSSFYNPATNSFHFAIDIRPHTPEANMHIAVFSFDLTTQSWANLGLVQAVTGVGPSGYGLTTNAYQANLRSYLLLGDGSFLALCSNTGAFTGNKGTPIIAFQSSDYGATWGNGVEITYTPPDDTVYNPTFQVLTASASGTGDSFVAILSIQLVTDGGIATSPAYIVNGSGLAVITTFHPVPGTVGVQYDRDTILDVNYEGVNFGGKWYWAITYSDDNGATRSPGVMLYDPDTSAISFTKLQAAPSMFISSFIGVNSIGKLMVVYDSSTNGTDRDLMYASVLDGSAWSIPLRVLTPLDYGPLLPNNPARSVGTEYTINSPYFFSLSGTDMYGLHLTALGGETLMAGVVDSSSTGPPGVPVSSFCIMFDNLGKLRLATAPDPLHPISIIA